MAIRIEKDGIESVLGKIQTAIDQLLEAAQSIDNSMQELPTYWEGEAYNRAESDYESSYRGFLTEKVPTTVSDFRLYIQKCKDEIINLDMQLSGKG